MPIELLALGVAGLLGAGGLKIAKGPPGPDEPVFGGRQRRRAQLFGYLNDQPTQAPRHTPPQQRQAPPQRRQSAGGREAIIQGDGKCFRAQCSIADVRFTGIIDTGASTCLIPRHVIASLGVDLRSIQYTTPFATPSGRSMAAVVPLPVTVQGITINDVECAVMQEDGGIKDALIGKSFLRNLPGGADLRGDTMILRA